MEVDVIQATSSKTIIHCLDAQFARHGLPKGLHTDNGSNLKSMRAAHTEGKNWREELSRFFQAYRSMPQLATGKSPAKLLFRRKTKTKMPELVNVDKEEVEVL